MLLVGHGTREAGGLAEMKEVVRQVAAACPHVLVRHAFLELAEPTISEAIASCVEQGVRRLTIQPLLLFAAGHAKRDIPAAVDAAAQKLPQLELRIAPHLACHPRLLDLSDLRFAESIADRESLPDAQTLLLLVGRGSHDPQANSEMAQFTRLRWERRALGWVETCFAAMTWPSLAQGLATAASLPARRIVVQPHLLFRGDLLSRIREQAAEAADQHAEKEWIIASHLGSHALLVETLIERAELGMPVAGTTGER
jgi:sirohydrochlorin cobaltochelatase